MKPVSFLFTKMYTPRSYSDEESGGRTCISKVGLLDTVFRLGPDSRGFVKGFHSDESPFG